MYDRDVIEFTFGAYSAHIRVSIGPNSGHNRVNSGHVRGLPWQVRGFFLTQPAPDWPRISPGVATNTHELDTMSADGQKNMSRMCAEYFIRLYFLAPTKKLEPNEFASRTHTNVTRTEPNMTRTEPALPRSEPDSPVYSRIFIRGAFGS